MTVTAEGTLGGIFDEFLPDITGKLFKNHLTWLRPQLPPDSSTAPASPPNSH
jgi:hypothetical protein